MKIKDRNSSVDLNKYLKGVDKAKSQGGAQVKDKAAIRKDSVQISQMSRDVSSAREAADKVPDIRVDKVDGLKQSVDGGGYEVEGEVVADSMIKKSLTDNVV